MIDEGYIKYNCNWIKEKPINFEQLKEINYWRNKLYQLGLIGEYDNGIGFGNLSIRLNKSSKFIISGTQTGKISILSAKHYTKVTEFNWDKNFITCVGPIKASSESLTHAAIYVANPEVNAIIHVHHRIMWENLLDKIPTTDKNCPYGTPEMAQELISLSATDELKKLKILVMGGHEEGIISFGQNLTEAGDILLNYF
jgi:ribulose-5-phosphate 4-epimerase/fuculose-1-phosphate aldolase